MSTVVLMVPSPAEAGSSVYCSGFSRCADKKLSDSGYRQHRMTSHWNMSTGTSCTNYVAYRLNHGGRLTARPAGTGSASTWGAAARTAGVPVGSRPRVGDVAWWGAHQGPAGKSGHVAYVEKVLASGAIKVSEDNFAKAFTWRKVVRGKGWPTGFIRYPRSDGSPSGLVRAVTSPAPNRLTVAVFSTEPDRPRQAADYLVTVGAPRGEEPVHSATFTSVHAELRVQLAVPVAGGTRVWVYGLNTPGTGGRDTLLGHRDVTIQGP